MTRVTFGVSASSFAANMVVKQNALDFALEASVAVEKFFYVDYRLTGANSVQEAVKLQRQLHDLFSRGGFLLHKWNSSEPSILQHIPSELKETHSVQALPSSDEYTKTLGVEWNARLSLTIADLPPLENVTKRVLVSDIAKTFDVLGWLSPTIIKVKVLLQQLWELKVDWDDPLPPEIPKVLLQWRSELKCLFERCIPRCYFPKGAHIVAVDLHGFSDASERAYVPPHNGFPRKNPSLTRNIQNKGSPNQASDNSSSRAVWCSSPCVVTPSCPACLWSTSQLCLCLDRQTALSSSVC